MNIFDYFNKKKDYALSQDDKLAIYNKFMAKRAAAQRPSFSQKIHAFRYAFSFVMIFFLSFGSYYTLNPDLLTNVFIGGNGAQAQNVAKIVDSQGFYVIHDTDNQRVTSDSIHHGDVIDIEQGSSVVVQISKSHNAKVVGPAKFQINYEGEKKNDIQEYRVKMLEGDYVAVESIDSEDVATDASEEAVIENVSVETDDGLVINDTEDVLEVNADEVADEDKKTSFVVQKSETNQNIIDNNGTDEVTLSAAENSTEAVVIPAENAAAVDEIVATDNVEALDVVIAASVEELEGTDTLSMTGGVTTGVVSTGVVTTGVIATGVITTGGVTTGIVVPTTGNVTTGIVATGTTTTGSTIDNDAEPVKTIETSADEKEEAEESDKDEDEKETKEVSEELSADLHSAGDDVEAE